MLFPSFTFILAFLPLTVAGYFLIGRRNRSAAQSYLLIASLVFYSWFNPWYFFIIFSSIVVNYFLATLLWRRPGRLIFIAGMLFNIGLLGYFKYYDFFVSNINALFGSSFLLKNILLPLGISFFTFQQISFLHAVYTRSLKENYSFLTYALFVTFFPQLVAGPIVLPDEMMPQFAHKDSLKVNPENLACGLYIFALGLAKKMLLADFFAEIADAGFAAPGMSFLHSWKTVLAYTFQIYFDFSGYCDMAIGIALLFNIKLPVNFDSPYLSADIGEFWRRWHITLGRFLSTYIYIPLGGSRCSGWRNSFNLLVTFLVSGLWHGASWLFVLWGLLHGGAMVVNRQWRKLCPGGMPKIPAVLLTFVFTASAWVLFRAESMGKAVALYRGMFLPRSLGLGAWLDWKWCGLFLTAVVITLFLPPASRQSERFRSTVGNLLLTVLLLCSSMFCFVKSSPFIYFNF